MITRCTTRYLIYKPKMGDRVILAYRGYKRRINLLNEDEEVVGRVHTKKKKAKFAKQPIFKSEELFDFLDLKNKTYYAKFINIGNPFSYLKIISCTTSNMPDILNIDETELSKMQNFLKQIKKGYSRNKAVQTIGISQYLVSNWFDKGLTSFEKFKQYVYHMDNSYNINTILDIDNLFGRRRSKNHKNQELNKIQSYFIAIKNGYSLKESIDSCDLTDFELEKWSFINNYLIFYLNFSKIKEEEIKSRPKIKKEQIKSKPAKIKEHSLITGDAHIKTSNFKRNKADNSKRAIDLRNEIFK